MTLRAVTAVPAVRKARARIRETDAATLQDQLRLTGIPAPPFAEAERAAYLRERLEQAGLAEVHGDEIGNVLARLPSDRPPARGYGRPVVVAAHLDTVFPEGTEVAPRCEGTRCFAPGITDNSRGLAALLAIGRVLVECQIRTTRPLWLVGTVGEEGLGDLRGAKHLFREGSPLRQTAAFISLDGAGSRRIVHRAIGSRRLRADFTGPGGHSWSDWGVPNPIHALGAAIAGIRGLALPATPPATLTVGRVGGGTSVNAIPAEAWMEIDIRSEDGPALRRLDEGVREVVARVVDEENRARRSGSGPLDAEIVPIGQRPIGATPQDHPLVQAAIAATRELRLTPELVASSTDANVPMSLGIPAITIGAGGEAGGVHTTEEWYDNQQGALGIERALLTVLAATGVQRKP